MSKFLLTIIIIGVGACSLSALADDDLNEIEAKVFDATRPPMAPSLTLQLLKHLEDKNYNKNATDSIHVKKIIQGLIGAWQIEQTDCQLENWNSLNKKISSYAGNVKRYLQFCRENFFIVCQEAQARNLGQASLQLNDLEVENVNQLKDTVIENDPRWWREKSPLKLYLKDSQISPEAVQKGLLKFVGLNNPLQTYDRDRGYFDRVLDQLVKFPCDKVQIHITPIIDDVYRLFPELNDNDNDLIQRLDQPTLNWIANTKVCSAMKNDWEALVNDAYKALQNQFRDEREKRAAWDRAQLQDVRKQEETNKNSGLYGYIASMFNYLTGFLG